MRWLSSGWGKFYFCFIVDWIIIIDDVFVGIVYEKIFLIEIYFIFWFGDLGEFVIYLEVNMCLKWVSIF